MSIYQNENFVKSDNAWRLVKDMVGSGRLSVVMPAYNLGKTIEENLASTAELFEQHQIPVELLPVDDGSVDATSLALGRAKSKQYSFVQVRPVTLAKNCGKGAALKAGFDASVGEYVMLLDGDLDIHPKQTPWFFAEMKNKGADVVVGSKRHKNSQVQYPWHRRFVSWVYFFLVRIFIGLPITDTQTGMKLFKRNVLSEALSRMLVKTYAFDLELLSIAYQRGAKIAEAPVVIRFGNKFGALSTRTVKTMAIDSLAVFYRLKVLRYYAKLVLPPKLETTPLVSVVIACPGPSKVLNECLTALGRQTYENFEVIVLPDEALNVNQLPCFSNGVLSILPTGKVRPAEKRNIGIKAAKGEVIAFIDDDAYPDAHWLEYAIKYFADDSIGGIGGPGVTPSNDSYLCKIGGRVYDNILVSGNYRYRYKAGGVCRQVDDYPSCNLFVRRDLLNKIGGYRTDFWPGEDTLLCKDIVDAGKRIVYDPWVVVYHHRRAIFGPHLRQLGRYAFHRGYFCKRFPSNSLRLSYFIPSAFVLYCLFVPLFFVLPFSFAVIALLPISIYLLISCVSSFALNPITWALTWLGIVASHFVYGIRFVLGLLASKAPCEFIGKDHA